MYCGYFDFFSSNVAEIFKIQISLFFRPHVLEMSNFFDREDYYNEGFGFSGIRETK